MTKLLNDTFDVLNGRRMAESINESNWEDKVKEDGKVKKGKKTILLTMLDVIDRTENCHQNPGKRQPMTTFASQTTLEGWRLSVSSAIDLTEELLRPKDVAAKYDFVLTAKWNQDPLEV